MTIPKTMKAAVLEQQNQPLVLDDVTMPEKLEYGQVLVKIHYTSICGSQLGEISGAKGPDKYLPHLLGHEASGTVMGIGPGVSSVQDGDSVVLHWRKGKGIEAAPPKYQWQGKTLNAGWITTFNEYAIVAENRVTAIPKDFDLKLAPLFGCAITTGFGVVVNDAKLSIGESIVVFGVGGVGLTVVQGAAMVSASPIIAIDIYDNRLELAAKLGATHTINSSRIDDLETEIRALIGDAGADVVVDTTGKPEMIALAYELSANQGRSILVGVPRKGNKASIYTLPLHFGKTLTGSHGGEAQPDVDIPKYIKLFQNGKLQLQELITDEFAFDDINQAIEKLRQGEIAGRALIKID